MAILVFKKGQLVDIWSTKEGSIEFNEKNEQAKPEASLYNIQRRQRQRLSER